MSRSGKRQVAGRRFFPSRYVEPQQGEGSKGNDGLRRESGGSGRFSLNRAGHRPIILMNSAAGRGGNVQRFKELSASLDAAGISADVRALPPGELVQAVAELAGAETVLGVCGGDGSIASAAGILAGTDTVLAPFPGGTLNHFSRRLGLPDHDAAARAFADGDHSVVPVGVVDDRIFLNTVTFGFYAGVVRRRERIRRWIRKWPGAVVGFSEQYARMPLYQLTLSVDGKVLRRETPLIWIGSGWGSFPRVVETPGGGGAAELEIVILRPRSRIGMARLLFRMVRYLRRDERPTDDPGLEILHTKIALIGGPKHIPATLDGEVLEMQGPVLVGIVDEALRVVGGRGSAAGGASG